MMHVVAKRWDSPASSPSGGTLDESIVRAELARVVSRLGNGPPAERVRLRARIVSLQHELAGVLARSGREHLASALWTSDDAVED